MTLQVMKKLTDKTTQIFAIQVVTRSSGDLLDI